MAIMLWMVMQLLACREVNGLWPLLVIDLSAMVYMWRAGDPVAAVSSRLPRGAGCSVGTNADRRLDKRLRISGIPATSVGSDGTVAVVAPISAAPLMYRLPLRASMITMALGMACMLAA